MDEAGLARDWLFYSDGEPTGVALILVDEKTSQNEIVIVPGACATITKREIESLKPRILESAYVLLQLEVNQDANEEVARIAKANGVRVIVNTAPYQPVSDEFLRECFLVTPNEVEAEALVGGEEDRKIAVEVDLAPAPAAGSLKEITPRECLERPTVAQERVRRQIHAKQGTFASVMWKFMAIAEGPGMKNCKLFFPK